jgi:hypothetical protein
MSPSSHSKMPVPMGVRWDGSTRPRLTAADFGTITPGPQAALRKAETEQVLGVSFKVDDPSDLTQAGWGVIFASDADRAIREQLAPLLDWRRSQVGDDLLYQEFGFEEPPAQNRGVRVGQTATDWAARRDVSLESLVDPTRGVPYYLLIVGSLERIPFEFQALLDLQWAVGRLHFDNVEDYGAYARKIVEYEQDGFRPAQRKSAASWMTRNSLDISTAMLCGALTANFSGSDPLGKTPKFAYHQFAAADATKGKLREILRGTLSGGPPAVLFTGSHGAEWPQQDQDLQRRMQGALVTQEWAPGAALDASNVFAAEDVPSDAQVHGMMTFLFACYGGGCPAKDDFFRNADGSSIPVAPESFVARLPQALLAKGTLAVIAHIDRAFTYSFENTEGTPQVQTMRTPLELLMRGRRVGLAVDSLNSQWGATAARVGVQVPLGTSPLTEEQANLMIARDDARNYIVLGDPAARLRTDKLQ